jgi:hypothetical protein
VPARRKSISEKMWGLFGVLAGYLVELVFWRKLDPLFIDRTITGRLFMLQAVLLPPLAWLVGKAYYYPYYASPLRRLPGPRVSRAFRSWYGNPLY